MLKRLFAYSVILALGMIVFLPPNASTEVAESQCTSCPQCIPQGTGRHSAPLSGGGFWGNGGHNFWDVPCGHPSCSGSASLDDQMKQGEIDRLLKRAFDGDVGAALALVNVYPEQVAVNYERNALQISSACDDAGIVAHIPMTNEIMVAIELRRRQTGPRHG